MLVRPNKRKANGNRYRHRSKKETFEVFDVSNDGTTLLGSSTGEGTSMASLKDSNGSDLIKKAVNVVEWRIHGDHVSTLNTLATVNYTESELHSSTKDPESSTSTVNNDSTTTLLALPPTDSDPFSLGRMFDDVVYQYGDLLQDETPEMQLDKENSRVSQSSFWSQPSLQLSVLE